MKPARQFITTLIASGLMFFSVCTHGKAVIRVKDSDTIDFGRFPGNCAKNSEFVLMNIGDSVLQIIKVNTNCSCLIYKLSSSTIVPGGSVVLKIHLRRSSVSGSFKKLIKIKFNTGPPLVLAVKGLAEPLVRVVPRPREYVGHPLPKTGCSREFQLTADRDGVVIGSPVIYGSGSKYCKVVLMPVDVRKWKLSVKMEQGKVGKVINTTVRLPIKAPKGWLPLIFNFRGRWGYELRTMPTRMYVPSNSREKIVREFELFILGSKRLDMKKLVLPSGPGIKISWQKLSEIKVKFKVELDPAKIGFKYGEPLKLKFEYPQSVYGVAIFIIRTTDGARAASYFIR